MQRLLFVIIVEYWIVACAGYTKKMVPVKNALHAGDYKMALNNINKRLGVDSAQKLPSSLKGEKPLLVLERAMILQAMNRFKESAINFQIADKSLELLDLQKDTTGKIGKYLLSGSSGVYKMPAYEKLMLNTMNMINYLALGDLNGARVEARRLVVMQNYLKNEKSKQSSLLGLGSYLAGFTFEMSGRYQEALRFYDEALQYDSYPSLLKVIPKLAQSSNYRTKRIEKILELSDYLTKNKEEILKKASSEAEEQDNQGTLLIIVGLGRVPHKKAKRIPIGLALTYAGAAMDHHALSSAQRRRILSLQLKGLLTWLNFAELTPTKSVFNKVEIVLNNQLIETEVGLNVGKKVQEAFQSIRPTLIAAAITRALTRFVVGSASEELISEGLKQGGGVGIGAAIGGLIGLGIMGAMQAADKPDTRSWTTLPFIIYLARKKIPPGSYKIKIRAEGQETKDFFFQINMKPGGFKVIPLMTLR
jgi:hypothetical protein